MVNDVLLDVEISIVDSKSSWWDKRTNGRFLPHKLAVELARFGLTPWIMTTNHFTHPKTIRLALVVACSVFLVWLIWHFWRAGQIPKYFGGENNVAIIASPDRVEVFQTIGAIERSTNSDTPFHFDQKANAGIVIASPIAKRLSEILLDPSSYEMNPLTAKEATFLPELVLTISRAGRKLDLFICLEAGDILVKSDDGFDRLLDIRHARRELKEILKPYVIRSKKDGSE